MKQNKFTFQSEKLVVDWISFNAKGLTDPEPIAKYLLGFGFNSFQLNSFQEGTTRKEIIFSHTTNKFNVIFSRPIEYWNGTVISFSGQNATYFYQLIQHKSIHFSFFPTIQLGRLDLHYFRKAKPTDNISVNDFFENCYRKINQKKRRQISLEGPIFTIGNRKSSNYFRIYKKKDGLEFELEIKKTPLKSFQDLLFSAQIQQFEAESSYYFLKSFAKIFPISYCFMDWLAVSLRPKINHSNLVNPLISDYIQGDNLISVADKKQLFLLLQLLSFLQSLDASQEFIRDQSYFVLTFQVQEFLKFIYPDTEVYNHYRLSKTLQFLRRLQNIEPLVTYFSETYFRSVVAFPYLLVEKQAKYWNVSIAIASELYFYQYPFRFPNFFIKYRNKYDFEVKLEILKIFSTDNTQKIFQTETFLKQFRVPNKCRSNIKKIILDLISELQILDIIESNYRVLSNGLYHQVNHLTLNNISKSFIFYEKLIFDI
jgi:hypothetical protein